MIKPTIGRVVWFWPYNSTNDQPCDAGIAYVHGDRCINISYADSNGVMRNASSVPLLQDDDAAPADGFYCEWMPYQQPKSGQPAVSPLDQAQIDLWKSQAGLNDAYADQVRAITKRDCGA